MKAKLACGAVTFLFLILCASLYATHLAAPAWDVEVFNPSGELLSDITVTETWQDYSCEHENHTLTLKTDKRGEVHFIPVHVHRNVAACAMETASELSAGVHASLGRHAHVDVSGVACVSDNHDMCVDWTGTPDRMSSRVAVGATKP
jgi:hypothetical protein